MTRRPKGGWDPQVRADAGKVPLVHRRWVGGYLLAGLALVLLLGGLVADLWLGSDMLALAGYVGGVLAGTALLGWMRWRRLWRVRPPRE